ncbi:ankyrin repeat protein [Kalaharituber pfeilii]|nr:ankyrin repeat protein [Kalaharituber pfeilii]
MTALHLAAIAGHENVVKLLLKEGAKIEEINAQGMTALHHAAQEGQVNAVKALLARGADRTARCKLEKTPLMLATEGGHAEVEEVLNSEGRAN